nr:hypothetical protein [Algoriphagus aquimarinus]
MKAITMFEDVFKKRHQSPFWNWEIADLSMVKVLYNQEIEFGVKSLFLAEDIAFNSQNFFREKV